MKDDVLPEVFYTALQERRILSSGGRYVELRDNISEGEAIGLYELVRTAEPAVSVEVGLAQGFSAMAILQAMNDTGKGKHVAIDPFHQAAQDVAWTELDKSCEALVDQPTHRVRPTDRRCYLPDQQFFDLGYRSARLRRHIRDNGHFRLVHRQAGQFLRDRESADW